MLPPRDLKDERSRHLMNPDLEVLEQLKDGQALVVLAGSDGPRLARVGVGIQDRNLPSRAPQSIRDPAAPTVSAVASYRHRRRSVDNRPAQANLPQAFLSSIGYIRCNVRMTY